MNEFSCNVIIFSVFSVHMHVKSSGNLESIQRGRLDPVVCIAVLQRSSGGADISDFQLSGFMLVCGCFVSVTLAVYRLSGRCSVL